MTTTDAERAALDEGLAQLRAGWAPEQIVDRLADAVAPIDCDWCDGPVIEPVRDQVEMSWLRTGARTWCSPQCQTARYDREINAEASP